MAPMRRYCSGSTKFITYQTVWSKDAATASVGRLNADIKVFNHIFSPKVSENRGHLLETCNCWICSKIEYIGIYNKISLYNFWYSPERMIGYHLVLLPLQRCCIGGYETINSIILRLIMQPQEGVNVKGKQW